MREDAGQKGNNTWLKKVGCLAKGIAILLAVWYVWALCVAQFDPWEDQCRYDGRLEDAVAATGLTVGDYGDGCTLSAEVPVGDIAVSVQITYDGPHRPMIFPWLPYNKIRLWSNAAYRFDKDYEPLSEWARKRNLEARGGKWTVAHDDFSKFPVFLSVGADAWIDWTPEQLGAAIRAVAEEAAVAIREFGDSFPTPALESPFSTPLTDEEAAPATGHDTPAPKDALLPPEYGLRLGMGLFRAWMARPGLRRDGESNSDGSDVVNYACLLPKRMGYGDILAAFEKGDLAWMAVNWSYDDGWTADDPGAIRKVLDDTLRRLGPPTKRWTKETERVLSDGTFARPDLIEKDTWHVWQWTKDAEDVIIEIRRSSDSRRTLRASFSAGALRRLEPGYLEFPADTQTE